MRNVAINFFCLSIAYFLGVHATYGQQAISTVGDHRTTSNFQISWTVGQVVQGTFADGPLVTTLGLHQSTNGFVVSTHFTEGKPTLNLFPNPANELLHVSLSHASQLSNISKNYKMLDLQGNLVLQGEVSQGYFQVNVSGLAGGIYLLQLKTERGTIHNYKFIKQ